MPLYTACKQSHTLVPVVNDLWVCECPAVYKKQGKHFLDPSRAGLLEAILKLMGSTQAIAERAKVLVDTAEQKRQKGRSEVISGYVK